MKQSYIADSLDDVKERKRLAILERLYDPPTQAALRAGGLAAGQTVLEIGPGGGSMLRWLSAQVGPEGRVVGIDQNPRFLTDLDLPNVTVVVGDVNRTELDAAPFDLVYCRFVLLHLPDPAAALRHIWTLPAPGRRSGARRHGLRQPCGERSGPPFGPGLRSGSARLGPGDGGSRFDGPFLRAAPTGSARRRRLRGPSGRLRVPRNSGRHGRGQLLEAKCRAERCRGPGGRSPSARGLSLPPGPRRSELSLPRALACHRHRAAPGLRFAEKSPLTPSRRKAPGRSASVGSRWCRRRSRRAWRRAEGGRSACR